MVFRSHLSTLHSLSPLPCCWTVNYHAVTNPSWRYNRLTRGAVDYWNLPGMTLSRADSLQVEMKNGMVSGFCTSDKVIRLNWCKSQLKQNLVRRSTTPAAVTNKHGAQRDVCTPVPTSATLLRRTFFFEHSFLEAVVRWVTTDFRKGRTRNSEGQNCNPPSDLKIETQTDVLSQFSLQQGLPPKRHSHFHSAMVPPWLQSC